MKTAAKLTEAAFTTQVIDLAHLMGWRVHHCRPARTGKGWRTALQGDAGLPDLIMVHAAKKRFLIAELKVGNNQPSPAQAAWLWACYEAEIEAYLWYPKDWPEIEELLGVQT